MLKVFAKIKEVQKKMWVATYTIVGGTCITKLKSIFMQTQELFELFPFLNSLGF